MYSTIGYMENIARLSIQERAALQKLLEKSDCEDNTELIQYTKNSDTIMQDVVILAKLSRSHADLKKRDKPAYVELCRDQASFLFTRFTLIFNKIVEDEVDLNIVVQMIKVLKLIESGEMGQHEGSVVVGKYLKSIYIDGNIRREAKLDAENDREPDIAGKSVSWREYKVMHGK